VSALETLSTGRPPPRRWIAGLVSVGAHGAILFALLAVRPTVPILPEPPTITVSLVREPEPPPVAAVGSAKSTPANAAPAPPARSPTASKTDTADAAPVGVGDVMTGAALGSATAADALPGGDCDMARRLQAALRRDALVRAAVSARGLAGQGSAILVWDGGWVASPGEDGKGLAAVREAIVWEVAFSPAACRAGRVHGPVLFSVSDTRIAVGAGDWRWGDLVSSR
jgi:hypothetical protein